MSKLTTKLRAAVQVVGLALLLSTPMTPILFSAPVAAAPTPAEQAANDAKCEYRILGLPTWFRGLSVADTAGNCTIIDPEQLNTAASGQTSNGLQNFIWRVVLNVIEMGLFIAGYVALGFVLFGGFQFLTGGSNPGQVEKARMTIINAVIGLAISMAAIAAVNLVFGLLQ